MDLDQDLIPAEPRAPGRPQIHLVALPHTMITREYDWCAYTAKLRRFTAMLVARGYTPVVYGPDEHECAEGTVYEPIVGPEDRMKWFGAPQWDSTRVFDQWDGDAPHWREMNMRAAVAIATHWQAGDILGLIAGTAQQLVVQVLQAAGLKPLVWEWGIGYSGILPEAHHTFESYAWAHHVAGLRHRDDIAFFDSVIPNCYDPADFTPSMQDAGYLLYMGRPTPRKGLPIIAEIAARTDLPVLVAGQPGADIPGTKYVGLVTGSEKAQLLAGARALLAPTTYLEPFGGVAVEAMLSGTPVIATDWGGFTETVHHGVSGVRCRTLGEFMTAVERIDTLDRREVLRHATARYTLDVGARMYDTVIRQLSTLHGDGWYTVSS
jgi:hypothetical protein